MFMSIGDFKLHFLFKGVSYLTALSLLALRLFFIISLLATDLTDPQTLIVKKKINHLSQAQTV